MQHKKLNFNEMEELGIIMLSERDPFQFNTGERIVRINYMDEWYTIDTIEDHMSYIEIRTECGDFPNTKNITKAHQFSISLFAPAEIA